MIHRRRILISTGLIALAFLFTVAGAIFHLGSRDIIVPINRSALETLKTKNQTYMPEGSTKVETVTRSLALKSSPDPKLIEKTSHGLLPRKAENGDRPADVYARPFVDDTHPRVRPRLSLVISRAGISETMTAEAYLSLPPDVSFVLSPYANDAERQMRDIRNRGHEVFLGLNSVTSAASHEDRGPYAFDPEKESDQNRERLIWAMSRFTGYAGLVADLTENAYRSQPLRDLIETQATTRGLSFLSIIRPDSQSLEIATPQDKKGTRISKLYLPGQRPSELATALKKLPARLKEAERLVVFINPGLVALDTLKDWILTSQSREFDLVPLSALMRSEEQG